MSSETNEMVPELGWRSWFPRLWSMAKEAISHIYTGQCM